MKQRRKVQSVRAPEEDCWQGITETNRKADDAHDRIKTHRDQCRRATKELETAEEDLNDSIGRMEQLLEDTAAATHALSCGIPDLDSHEVRYLHEALDMIEDFQRRGSCRYAAEITLVERQRKVHLAEDEIGSMLEFIGEFDGDEATDT